MALEILDPTHEGGGSVFARAPRLATLEGTTVAFVSNGKRGVKPFFDGLEDELRQRYGVAEVVRLTKTNYSAPAERDLLADAGRWHALIAGVGD